MIAVKGGVPMSKSKKNAKNNARNQQNGAQNCENNMSYATDKKPDHAADCHEDQAQNKNESNCR